MARLFHEALFGPFLGAYREIVFAILDSWPGRRIIGPFERRFGIAVA